MQAGDAVVGAVHRVARHRVVDGSHVNADLVGTARFQAALQHRELAQPFQHLVAGIGVLCVGLTGRIDRHLLAVGLAAAQVALHKALILGKAAIDDGIVGPLHAVHCHLLGKADVGCIVLCHHQPLVSLSMRWTMPGRISPPMPERLPLQCQSRALTRVPSGLPGAGWTTIPLGLLTTRRCASS